MRLLRHDLHSLSGAYALDALEAGSERDRFTRHLSRCQSCASEVRGFREVATASIAVAVLFGFAQAHTQDELNQVKAENQAISLLLSAPEAKLLTHEVTNGGVATVVLAADRHELAVVTTGLPALPSGQVYQLWLIGKPKIVSAGLLPPAKNGQTPAVLATGVAKGDTLGLTVEPAGGSAQPTTTPILALPLPV